MKIELQLSARRTGSKSAFTMVEIAVSIAIIGFALVAIIGVLPTGLNVQRDNREETIINQDANFLMAAIRNGSTNLSILVNAVDRIRFGPEGAAPQSWVINTNVSPVSPDAVMGVLSIPKFMPNSGNFAAGFSVTNTNLALVRAFSGPLAEKGTNTGAKSFAFSYLLTTEIIPFELQPQSLAAKPAGALPAPSDPTYPNVFPGFYRYNRNVQGQSALFEIRLTFRWPVLPDPTDPMGRPGLGRQVYRGLVAGRLVPFTGNPPAIPNGYRMIPLTFTNSL